MCKKLINRSVAIAILVLFSASMASAANKVGPAPDFELPTDSGKVHLSQLKDKVVYVDFWASWCVPCRKSFPWMNEMKKRYGDQGLEIVAINLDQDHELAKRFLKKIPASFTVAYDPDGAIAEKYKVVGMPSSYIINREGLVVKSHLGFREKDTPDLEELLRMTLEY
ncbi:MAG: TlpA disulfide reductase family protein [Gammaproteobacteria bacterium]|nr:TlpA disulfide reductase family protein [Gammaproteobacteria bacterium]